MVFALIVMNALWIRRILKAIRREWPVRADGKQALVGRSLWSQSLDQEHQRPARTSLCNMKKMDSVRNSAFSAKKCESEEHHQTTH